MEIATETRAFSEESVLFDFLKFLFLSIPPKSSLSL